MNKKMGSDGVVLYEVKGTPSYTLNVLAREGVTATKIIAAESSFRFTIAASDKIKTEKILNAHFRKFVVLRESGIKKSLAEFFVRYAFIFGLLVAIFLVYSYTTLITDITYDGNREVSAERLAEVCESVANTPSIYRAPDLDGMEKALAEVDGIAYAKVSKVGRKLLVKVVEELPVTDIIDTQNPYSVIAKEGGVVTRIVTLRGTPAVKEGDMVDSGTELIYPYILGADGVMIPTRSMGIVEARVRRTEEAEYSYSELPDDSVAEEIARRTAAYRQTLGDDEIFVGSSFEVKKLDKSCIISIYYEIITRIS